VPNGRTNLSRPPARRAQPSRCGLPGSSAMRSASRRRPSQRRLLQPAGQALALLAADRHDRPKQTRTRPTFFPFRGCLVVALAKKSEQRQCGFASPTSRGSQMVHPRWPLATIAAIVLALSAAPDRQWRLVHVIDLHRRNEPGHLQGIPARLTRPQPETEDGNLGRQFSNDRCLRAELQG
jgi:hypothetical protein